MIGREGSMALWRRGQFMGVGVGMRTFGRGEGPDLIKGRRESVYCRSQGRFTGFRRKPCHAVVRVIGTEAWFSRCSLDIERYVF
jgi:hypothetical protein